MDNLTHTLFGATLARTPLARAGRGTTAALLLASNAPDSDIIAAGGGALDYLAWHRGPTHGILGIVGLGLATAGLVWIGGRLFDRRTASAPASFPALAAVSVLAVFCHILMDLPTVYGTRIFSPFNWRWYAMDWMPIIDVYLWMILAGGVLAALTIRSRGGAAAAERRRHWSALIVLGLMFGNYGIRAASHHAALASAPQVLGPLLPPTCAAADSGTGVLRSWSRDSEPARPAPDAAPCLIEIAAIPSFTSPFEWRVLARLSNAYIAYDVNVLDTTAFEPMERASERYPDLWTPSVVIAAERADVARSFLEFARFPAVRSAVGSDGVTTVQWTDLRFASGPPDDELASRRRDLFTATVEVAPDGRIVAEQLGR
jgi:membrane-bound metal-dependent hydrolase YbcI (DUF457 family)